jgi:hypothetical protein
MIIEIPETTLNNHYFIYPNANILDEARGMYRVDPLFRNKVCT